jgi:hypothetical protein
VVSTLSGRLGLGGEAEGNWQRRGQVIEINVRELAPLDATIAGLPRQLPYGTGMDNVSPPDLERKQR